MRHGLAPASIGQFTEAVWDSGIDPDDAFVALYTNLLSGIGDPATFEAVARYTEEVASEKSRGLWDRIRAAGRGLRSGFNAVPGNTFGQKVGGALPSLAKGALGFGADVAGGLIGGTVGALANAGAQGVKSLAGSAYNQSGLRTVVQNSNARYYGQPASPQQQQQQPQQQPNDWKPYYANYLDQWVRGLPDPNLQKQAQVEIDKLKSLITQHGTRRISPDVEGAD